MENNKDNKGKGNKEYTFLGSVIYKTSSYSVYSKENTIYYKMGEYDNYNYYCDTSNILQRIDSLINSLAITRGDTNNECRQLINLL